MRISPLQVQAIFLIALQVTVTAALWVLNPLSPSSTKTFALFVSVDLLSFVMISYLYRALKYERRPSMGWTSVGYLLLLILLTVNAVNG